MIRTQDEYMVIESNPLQFAFVTVYVGKGWDHTDDLKALKRFKPPKSMPPVLLPTYHYVRGLVACVKG